MRSRSFELNMLDVPFSTLSSWKQPILWAVLFIATFYNLAILREAVRIPFLRGSDLAQADLSLFMTQIFFGIPVLIACLGVLSFTLIGISRVSRDNKSFAGIRSIAMKNPIVLTVLGNLVLQVVVWIFLLYIMRYGLSAVTDWTR